MEYPIRIVPAVGQAFESMSCWRACGGQQHWVNPTVKTILGKNLKILAKQSDPAVSILPPQNRHHSFL